ncbi:hypothetical protein TorRG33x02_196450 [Trema orientale]|uniref:Uncharacterized protein n=1 Tax=Trema orientale TaxID=63057 RepID=A0A2P5EGB0_TREOI|nr:hypothetical protein TorRG33x02_196450 [Trema orientale]
MERQSFNDVSRSYPPDREHDREPAQTIRDQIDKRWTKFSYGILDSGWPNWQCGFSKAAPHK